MPRINQKTRTIAGQEWWYNPYTNKWTRSKAYAKRMQSAYERGQTQQEARGSHVRSPGGRRTYAETKRIFEERHGISYTFWRRMQRGPLKELNKRSAPGGRITPEMIHYELYNADYTGHDYAWVEARIRDRLRATRAYQDDNDPDVGHTMFVARDSTSSIEWWFYH